MTANLARSGEPQEPCPPAFALGLSSTLLASGSARARHARAAPGLHARRLSSLRRRNPQRPRHHRLPAPAEDELEPGLRGGVRAVSLERFVITPAARFMRAA